MDRIDHKDEPGEYRNAVFSEVQKLLNFTGHKPNDANAFLGDWECSINPYLEGHSEPKYYQSFLSDGSAPVKACDGSYENPKDKWEFNKDNSISLWTYVEAMPEYGLEEPTYSEDCYHVLIKNENEFVLFNGDGSLIFHYKRVNA